VRLDRDAPRGELAVYLDGVRLFSRIAQGRFPEIDDLVPALQQRLGLEGRVPDRTGSDSTVTDGEA